LKDEICGDQECDIITELPECVEDDTTLDNSSNAYYIISKRDTASKPIRKTRPKNPEKIELYVKISKNLGIWRPSSTRSENIKKVKEELKKVNSSERFRKRLRNMNLDFTVLKLDETVSCNSGSVSRKLVCGMYC
jgi:CUB/sushi domain-containing protein